jgi:hypothetical protein
MTPTRSSLAARVAGLLMGAALVLPASPALAQERPVAVRHMAPQQQGKAQVELMVVKADSSGKVDPRLKSLQRQLSFTNFTGFSVLSEDSVKLAKGQSDTVAGGPGYKVKLKLVSQEQARASVRLQVLRGSESRVDTTVKLPSGRAFIVKGPKVNGGALIYVMTYR